VIHYVPDPIEIADLPVADLCFVGCGYTPIPVIDKIVFEMRAPELSIRFGFFKNGRMTSIPVQRFGDSEEVWDLLWRRHPKLDTAKEPITKEHITSRVLEGEYAGPEIMSHIEYWLGNSLNIEIDLSELRRSVM
jgi:hypothetical protein